MFGIIWSVVVNINKENLNNSVGTSICTPASLSQEVGLVLRVQACKESFRQAGTEGGFSILGRVAETPY